MRKFRSPLALAALAALLLAPSGSRSVAAWPRQGTIERAQEVVAPAHRAPEAPRLLVATERGQGSARTDRAPSELLGATPTAIVLVVAATTASDVAPGRANPTSPLGAPLFPTGPPRLRQPGTT